MERFDNFYSGVEKSLNNGWKILAEKYYTYEPPADKEVELYDFYVLNYLLYLLNQPSPLH